MRFALLLSILFSSSVMAAPDSEPKRYVKTSGGYLMVLQQGDDVFKQIQQFAAAEKIKGATFTGMGFVNVKFGFFDFKKKDYVPKDFKSVELASMTGSLAWESGEPSIHAHGVVTDKDFRAFGGHILEAQVDTGTLEVRIELTEQRLTRKMNETLGWKVLEISDGKE